MTVTPLAIVITSTIVVAVLSLRAWLRRAPSTFDDEAETLSSPMHRPARFALLPPDPQGAGSEPLPLICDATPVPPSGDRITLPSAT